MSYLWKKVHDEMVNDKTFTKQHKHNFGSQSKISRFQTYFTNHKVPRNFMGFSDRAHTFTPLNYLS